MHLSQEVQQTIPHLCQSLQEEVIALRRQLHQAPELSGKEEQTSTTLMTFLQEHGITCHPCVCGYGFYATIQGDLPGGMVILRADMDALPIQEINQVDYASAHPGLMHACGHDVHSAIVAGVGLMLQQMRTHLHGSVRLLFQPEEESVSGAIKVIRSGALDNPRPKAIFGMHVCALPSETLGWNNRQFLSGYDHYLVSLKDKKHSLDDNLLDEIAAECCRRIEALNTLSLPGTSEEEQAMWQSMQQEESPLSNFRVYSASLPEEEDKEDYHGCFGLGYKAASHAMRRAALDAVRGEIRAVCEAKSIGYTLTAMGSMRDVINDPHLVAYALEALQGLLPVKSLQRVWHAYPFNCEDFSFYLKHSPGAMFWLGAGKRARLHRPDFEVDERCIPFGMLAFSAMVLGFNHS